MLKYVGRRLLMMIPTFLGITLITFVIISGAPGGPVEQKLREIRFGGGGAGGEAAGVNQAIIDELNRQYGFDKPILIRYGIWLKNVFTLDFGESFRFQEPVFDVIASKFPVSLQFGLVSFFLTYLICIPLGVLKAIRAGSTFDHVTTGILLAGYSIPPLVFGILLITFLAGGSFLDVFPIGGFVSENHDQLGFWGKIGDRIHHFILPTLCYMIGQFTVLTSLMRNSMLEVISMDYVRTARAKGLPDRLVYFKHALRNALIPIATGLGGFLGLFLAGSLIIERIFQLDGIGLLSFDSAMARDYNVLMGILFLSSMFMMAGRLVSDLIYVLIDPRIDFS